MAWLAASQPMVQRSLSAVADAVVPMLLVCQYLLT
jgi:hypothetical protein